MNGLRWMMASAIALTMVGMAGTTAGQAQSPPPAEAPAPVESAPTVPDGFQTYVLPRAFSLQIPESWAATGVEADRYAVITNYGSDRPAATLPAAADIKTEVWLFSEPPDTFVNRSIQAIVEKEYQVSYYRSVVVDELPALRVWMSDLPLDYPYQIITYVGYASYGTAMIVTQYATSTPETEALVEQIHNSFTLTFE